MDDGNHTNYLAPHLDTAALLIIDMQHDFIDGVMPVPGSAAVVPMLATVAAAFRRANRPVVHVIRYYQPGSSDVDLVRRPRIEAGAQIAAPGTYGAAIPAALLGATTAPLSAASLLAGEIQHLGPQDFALYKPRWSAFHRTNLEAWLHERGVDTVVVAGCNLPNCPRATLFDASERDFRTVLVTDAVSQITSERLNDLRLIGVNLLTAAETIALLANE